MIKNNTLMISILTLFLLSMIVKENYAISNNTVRISATGKKCIHLNVPLLQKELLQCIFDMNQLSENSVDKAEYNNVILRFEKSKTKNKMYDAILLNKKTNRNKKIPFGDNKMENYRDITGLNRYRHLIHNDKKRRKNFRSRHGKNAKYKFSSAYFAYKYLW